MSLVCLSFSHQHVPIAFRERVFFDADSIANACARFRCGDERPPRLIEFAILSTCNRTEIYAFTSADELSCVGPAICDEIYTFISQARDIEPDELQEYGRWIFGADVVNHLSRVACGIESLVLGEPQILGQVGDAMRIALAMNAAGPVLTRLFQAAIRSGRRARSETQIGCHSLNISTVAVNTAEHNLGSLVGKTVVLLGAGEMADLALEQFRKRGVTDIRVVNRTIARAQELSQKHDGRPYVFERITSLLAEADVLLSSTGAPHTLITKDMITATMQRRENRTMTILDIAVPRDVDPTVEEIDNVFRCDIDDLHISTGQAAGLRRQQIPDVEQIVDEEADHYLAWLRSIGVDSIVASLHRKAEEIRTNELARLAALLPNQEDDAWQIIQRFSRSLVRKILHDPTVQLRENHGTRAAVDHAEAVRQLFHLEFSAESPEESSTASVILEAQDPKMPKKAKKAKMQ